MHVKKEKNGAVVLYIKNAPVIRYYQNGIVEVLDNRLYKKLNKMSKEKQDQASDLIFDALFN